MDKLRKRLYRHEAEALGLEVKENEGDRNQARYYISRHQWRTITEARTSGFTDLLKDQSISPNHVPHLWVKSEKTSAFVRNPFYGEGDSEIDFSEIASYTSPSQIEPSVSNECDFDRLIYTDVHIGMDVNPDGNSPYNYKWDKKELEKRMIKMATTVINNKKSPVLYIDDLGDFMDGFNKMTTRGGHALPQNMGNQEAYMEGFKFKVGLIDLLITHYEKIVCNNVCQDNHSGDFGFIVNESFKQFIQVKYNNVSVNNITTFMDYYKHGNKVFVLCHGKDSNNMGRPFPVFLNNGTQDKISSWLLAKNLIGRGYEIEFSKGDSHQWVFDRTTALTFNYFCYPSLAPPSQWVQRNFKACKSGFTFRSYGEYVTNIDIEM